MAACVILPALVMASDPFTLHWNALWSLGVYNASTLIGGPLGEEPGWRGYATRRLQERIGPPAASGVVGVLWAAWHLPLFFIPGWTSSPFWAYVLLLTGVSILLTFVMNVAELSVLPAIIGHAAFNTVPRFVGGLVAGAQPRLMISFVTLLTFSAVVSSLILIALTRGRLGIRPRDQQHSASR